MKIDGFERFNLSRLSAKDLSADLTLMDEWKGRRLAVEEGLAVVGSVGILEQLYRRGEIIFVAVFGATESQGDDQLPGRIVPIVRREHAEPQPAMLPSHQLPSPL